MQSLKAACEEAEVSMQLLLTIKGLVQTYKCGFASQKTSCGFVFILNKIRGRVIFSALVRTGFQYIRSSKLLYD
jgi:hypothetical protein